MNAQEAKLAATSAREATEQQVFSAMIKSFDKQIPQAASRGQLKVEEDFPSFFPHKSRKTVIKMLRAYYSARGYRVYNTESYRWTVAAVVTWEPTFLDKLKKAFEK